MRLTLSTFGQLWNNEELGETRQKKWKKTHSRHGRAHSSVCVIVFNCILIVHAVKKIVSSTGEAEKKDAKTSHRLGGMLGQWMERGRTPNGTGEEAHTLTSQFWHIFPSENQNQLKHQIKKKKKKKTKKEKKKEEEMKENQNIHFLSNPGDGGEKWGLGKG